MAIETVNARYEGFIFDGENSRTYGVYVTDVEVFGAPVRNVEMISIPGRNGSFALDKGSYENIQVTYKCAMGCESQEDFNAGISAFRNMLASRIGYKRLEDEINTDEYRMACFRGGISVPTLNKETATFDVVFDCKPQRYLKSGETAVSVSSGGTITNPTLYDASPTLLVDGYGDITIDGDRVSIFDLTLGMIDLPFNLENRTSTDNELIYTITDTSYINHGDLIYFTPRSLFYGVYIEYSFAPSHVDTTFTTPTTNISSYGGSAIEKGWSYSYAPDNRFYGGYEYALGTFNFAFGTNSTETVYFEYSITGHKYNPDRTDTQTVRYEFSVSYDGSSTITISADIIVTSLLTVQRISMAPRNNPNEGIKADSSYVPANTIYMDMDIGEAYIIDGGSIISANNLVSIPAKLPVLVPGANTITYDNTITQFKIVPRWWQL